MTGAALGQEMQRQQGAADSAAQCAAQLTAKQAAETPADLEAAQKSRMAVLLARLGALEALVASHVHYPPAASPSEAARTPSKALA